MPGTRVISLLGLSACLTGGAAGDPVGTTDRAEALSVMMEAYTPCDGPRGPSTVLREEITSFKATREETRSALARIAERPTVCSEVRQAAGRLLSTLDTQPDALAHLFPAAEGDRPAAPPAAEPPEAIQTAGDTGSVAGLWTRPPGSGGLRRTSDY